jgi:hypothetical protein
MKVTTEMFGKNFKKDETVIFNPMLKSNLLNLMALSGKQNGKFLRFFLAIK